MKLCDRCRVPGCCLNYLGKACENARKEYCPEAKPTKGELMHDMDYNQMAAALWNMCQELCKDGVPSKADIVTWLTEES